MATTTQQTTALSTGQTTALSTDQVPALTATQTANPYDLNANTPADLATKAATGIKQANTTGYTTTDVTAGGYEPTKWNVDSNQTVQGQLQGLISSQSPLMQLAETQAKQQMNQRGLLNSSMAIGAGQEAVIKQATPIATSDATIYANQAKYNADAATTAAAFKAKADNDALQLNAAAKNSAANFEAAAKNTASANYTKDINATVSQMMDIAFKTGTANADNATKLAVQKMASDSQIYLADSEAKYKNQMQASASANELYQQITKNIADIMANPDLDVTAKQSAVDAQKAYLTSGMEVLGTTSGIKGLSDLINFETTVQGTVTGGGGGGSGSFTPPAALSATANFQQIGNQFGNSLDTAGGTKVSGKNVTFTYKDPVSGANTTYSLPADAYYDPNKKQIVDPTGKTYSVPSGLITGAASDEQRRAMSPGIQAGDTPDELRSTFEPAGVQLNGAKVNADGSVTLKGGTVIPAGATVIGDRIYKPDGTLAAIKPADDTRYGDRMRGSLDAAGANLDGATFNADGSVKLKNGTVISAGAYAKDGVLYDASNKVIAIKPADDNNYRSRLDNATGSAGLEMDKAVYNADGTVKLRSGTVLPAGVVFKDGKLVTATGAAVTLKPVDVMDYEGKIKRIIEDKNVNLDDSKYDAASGNVTLRSGTVIPGGSYIKDGKLVNASGAAIALKPVDLRNYEDTFRSAIDRSRIEMDGANYNQKTGEMKLKSGTVIPAGAYEKDGKIVKADGSAIALKPIDIRNYENDYRDALNRAGVFLDDATYNSTTGEMKLKTGTVIPAGAFERDGKLVKADGSGISLNANDNRNIRNSINDKWGGYFNMGNVTTYNADGSFKLKSGTTIPASAVERDGKIYAKESDKTPITLKNGDR